MKKLFAIAAILILAGCFNNPGPQPPATPTPTPATTESPLLAEAIKVIGLFCPGTVAEPLPRALVCERFLTDPLVFAKCLCSGPEAVPTATPTAAATSAPAATPTLAPTPTPTLVPPVCSPSTGKCLGTTPGEHSRWQKNGKPIFYQAMQAVFAKHPEYFFPKGTQACQWEVVPAHVQDYFVAVQLELHLIYAPFCTEQDPHDLTQVNMKMDNSYSETFHPLRTDGDFPPSQCVSDADGIFAFHCTPAGF